MFKRLYSAGFDFAENTLQKAFRGKTMTPEEKKDASGMLGLALGGILENVGLGGMALTLVAGAIIGFTTPGGLPLATLAAGLLAGTALAGIGTFGIGMQHGADKNCGFLTFSREFHRSVRKEILNTILRRPKTPDATTSVIFKEDAKPASESFAQAAQPAQLPQAAPEVLARTAATVSTPEPK